MTRGNLDATTVVDTEPGLYLMLLPQKMSAASTARLAQASKVRGLAGGHCPVLLRVSECLRGKELFEFIALGTQIWHPAPC